MTSIKKFIIALAVYVCYSLAFAVTSADYTITYKNQQGSALTLTWHPEKNNSGILSGLLSSKSVSSLCNQNAGIPATVSGMYTGNAIAFLVNYPRCDKVMTMTGNLRNNNTELQMLWLVTSQAKDYKRDNININQIGYDTYMKIAS